MNEVRKEALLTFQDLVRSPVIKKSLPMDISELFKTQKNTERFKRVFRQEFPEVVKLYFSKFLKKDSVDASALLETMEEQEVNMRRQITLRYDYIKFIATMLKFTEEKKKGLIAS